MERHDLDMMIDREIETRRQDVERFLIRFVGNGEDEESRTDRLLDAADITMLDGEDSNRVESFYEGQDVVDLGNIWAEASYLQALENLRRMLPGNSDDILENGRRP